MSRDDSNFGFYRSPTYDCKSNRRDDEKHCQFVLRHQFNQQSFNDQVCDARTHRSVISIDHALCRNVNVSRDYDSQLYNEIRHFQDQGRKIRNEITIESFRPVTYDDHVLFIYSISVQSLLQSHCVRRWWYAISWLWYTVPNDECMNEVKIQSRTYQSMTCDYRDLDYKGSVDYWVLSYMISVWVYLCHIVFFLNVLRLLPILTCEHIVRTIRNFFCWKQIIILNNSHRIVDVFIVSCFLLSSLYFFSWFFSCRFLPLLRPIWDSFPRYSVLPFKKKIPWFSPVSLLVPLLYSSTLFPPSPYPLTFLSPSLFFPSLFSSP